MRVAEDGGTPEPFTRADAGRSERRLADPHFLPDGRTLLYSVAHSTPTTARSRLIARPQLSPDGRFVAYQSDTSGRWEVYVMPFPKGEGRIRVSTDGGQHVRWNPKGGELFYVSGDDIMAVSLTLQPTLHAGRPQRLFGGKDVGTQLTRPRYLEAFYDVAPDGRSFVVVKGHAIGTSDVVIADNLLGRAQR